MEWAIFQCIEAQACNADVTPASPSSTNNAAVQHLIDDYTTIALFNG